MKFLFSLSLFLLCFFALPVCGQDSPLEYLWSKNVDEGVTFGFDNDHIIFNWGGNFILQNIENNSEVQPTFYEKEINYSFKFLKTSSRNGYVAVACEYNTRWKVFMWKRGTYDDYKLLWKKDFEDPIISFDFSHDEKFLLVKTKGGKFFIYETQSQSAQRVLSAEPFSLDNSIKFKGGSNKILCCDESKSGLGVEIWDISTNSVEDTVKKGSQLYSADYSKDGKFAAFAYKNSTVEIVDAKNLQVKRTISLKKVGDIKSVDFSIEGRYLAVSIGCSEERNASSGRIMIWYNRRIELWDVATGAKVATIGGGDQPYAENATFSPDGKYFACTYGSSIKVWRLKQSKITPPPPPPPPPPPSSKRVAFVVGNNNYKNMPSLKNAGNDSKRMAVKLKELGFEVIELQDADKTNFWKKMHEFQQKLQNGTDALFYFSGHGVQFNNKNYLAPIDADTSDSNYIAVDSLLSIMGERKDGANILIFDACRTSEIGGNQNGTFVKQNNDKGSFLAFSTSPNEVARDDSPECQQNGMYTCELLKHLKKGAKIEKVFKLTRKGVKKNSQNFQIPWEHSSLVGEFEF